MFWGWAVSKQARKGEGGVFVFIFSFSFYSETGSPIAQADFKLTM